MGTLAGLPFFPIDFGKQGQVLDPAQVEAIEQHVSSLGNLLVLSHGWNNDKSQALSLYEALLTNVKAQYKDAAPLCVLGVFWPSKKFADSALIPGGAASADSADPLGDRIDELKGFFDAEGEETLLEELRQLGADLSGDEAKGVFVSKLVELVGGQLDLAEEGQTSEITATDLFGAVLAGTSPSSDFEGGAAGLGDFISGAAGLGENVLNTFTYYQMKKRAGIVGSGGVLDVLVRLKKKNPALKLHLVGHSFGGRLVTSACLGRTGGPSIQVQSLTLLQAAFSHNGFAKNFHNGENGAFLPVITNGNVNGPIVITHTRRDTAVGIAYAIASRLAGQDAAGIGGADDRFGGIGANGAQKSNALALQLLSAGQAYTLQKGRIHNLLADEFISDHGDVAGREVAHALVAAITAGGS